jgi:hypothetical protein
LSDFAIPEQDLWALTSDLIKKLPIKVAIKWVKGHQDENSFGDKIYGPFTLAAQMNILTDALATKGMKMERGDLIRPTLKTSVVALYTTNNVYVTDLRKYMKNNVNSARLLEYYSKKRGWNESVIKEIDLEGVHGLIAKSNPIKRIQRVKLLHNWQNTGTQKGRMRDARLNLGSENQKTPTIEETSCHLCPDGCGEEEVDLHYLSCPKEDAKTARVTMIKKVLLQLRKMRTDDSIISVFGYVLKKVSNREEVNLDLDATRFDKGSLVLAALVGQARIGWLEFCQGLLHVGWAKVQRAYYQHLGKNNRYLNVTRWKRMASTILSGYCLECWERRNKTIHGEKHTESRQKKLAILRRQVREIYKEKRNLRGTKNQGIFDMPLEKRLNMGIHSTTIWIGMAEEVLCLHREATTKVTIHQWLQHR